MNILCLWVPDWPTDEESAAELTALLLAEAPRVVLEARGLIWVDARGLPAERLAHRLIERLAEKKREGIRVGGAYVPIVAEAAARSPTSVLEREARSGPKAGDERGQLRLVPHGREAAFLSSFPLSLISTDERLLTLLEGAGIKTCGQLANLTAEAVEVRFGDPGVKAWRLSRGDDPRLLFRPIPPERPNASVDFLDYTIRDATRLVFTLNALIEQICEELRRRGRRARSITLTFSLADGRKVREALRTARPTADRSLWIRRIRAALERIKLPDAIAGVALEVDSSESISALQGDLFDRGFATAGFVEEAVGRLLDLYRGLFVRQLNSGHPVAERRTRWVELTPDNIAQGEAAAQPSDDLPTLQLQLLNEPRAIRVRTLSRRDHVVPTKYLDGQVWRKLTSAGPDRISGGHEETSPYAREYFRCVSESGSLLWVYRDAAEDRWFLHGWWD
jgi:protein ImuB